jgi:hypothetical protein
LGKINFLRRFISNFVELVKYIKTMLRKGNEFKWTTESRNSFDQIKKALTEAPVLISPDYSKDFLIFSFASFDTAVNCFIGEKCRRVRVAYCLFQQGIEGC